MQSSLSFRFLIVVSTLAVALVGLPSLAGAQVPPPSLANCQNDVDGANDNPGQKDVTRTCIDAGDGSPYEILNLSNWDEITLQGGNTADVCTLFNTDADAFANLAVCVTLESAGAPTQTAILSEVRLFTCSNTKSDRCTGSTQLNVCTGGATCLVDADCPGGETCALQFNTMCEVTQGPSDPFSPADLNGPGDAYPDDTEILCGIDLADFGAAGSGATLIDTCSYPSTVPNSAPSDCILFTGCSLDSECDDGNGCTADTCDTAGFCVFTPTPGTACTDGLFCNGDELCNSLGFCDPAAAPRDCDDGVGCTVDSCDELLDVCVNAAADSLCNDTLFCNGVEVCDPINDCQPGTPPDCDDGVGCTIDACNETTDSCDNTTNDGLCGDGAFCNGSETCDITGDCQPGVNPCAPGQFCDESADACVECLVDADCSNGQFCDGAETCDPSGVCQPAASPVDCDDGVACTVDSCNEGTDSCDNIADNASCDDGAFCNGVEFCDPINDCQAGIAPDCSDGVGCTVDSCNEGTDSCDNTANDALCDDGLFCNGSETCDAVSDCQAGTAPNCDDGVGCTVDSCNEGTDSCDNIANNASCNDGLFCNGAETCDAVSDCQPGSAPNCNDGVGCTVDSCNETTDSCDNIADNGSCDNGAFCDGVEICDVINDCQPGTDPCPGSLCSEALDQCGDCLVDADCSNGLFCDGVETCDAGLTCQPGSPVDCDDGVGCTVDSCNEGTDSCDNIANNASCSDGLFCNGAETCDAVSDCQPGSAPNCNDGVGCTDDSCNETTDSCDNIGNNGSCDNGAFCDGVEICDVISDCQAGTDPCPGAVCDEGLDQCGDCLTDADCNNGVFCDGVETCDGTSTCQPGSPVNCDDGVGCTVDSCNEGTDSCDNTANDASCSNGQFCDGAETCDTVSDCQPGSAPNCNDGVGCTTDSCNETTDSCDNIADNGSCDNGAFCDGVEICDVISDCQAGTDPCPGSTCDESLDQCGDCLTDADCNNGVFCDGVETCDGTSTCQPGSPVNCDDGVGCTVDACNEATDSCDNTANNASCSDGLFCNGAETCNAVSDCQAGSAPNCADGVGCTADSCNETTDSCDNITDDVSCDDGAYCNGVEVCDPINDCQAGIAPDCSDGVGCTDDTCNEPTDSCDNTPNDANCDNGLFCDGAETCDAVSDCQPGSAPNCDDGVLCTSDTCNEGTDSCDNTPDDALCDDGLFCNGAETCDASGDCQLAADPCLGGICDEALDLCGDCLTDADCDDLLFCNGVETCGASLTCQPGSADPCDDGLGCTDDNCDEATDLCDYDFSACVCGDGDVTGSEECDPPVPAGSFEDCNNLIDDDGDGRIDCRDRDCRPGGRSEICDENCSLDVVCEQFIRDPGIIKFKFDEKPDVFTLHGQFPVVGGGLNPTWDAFFLELSNDRTPIYRASMDALAFKSNKKGTRFKFKDKEAKHLGQDSVGGGLYNVALKVRPHQGVPHVAFRFKVFGDFGYATQQKMTTQISVGSSTGFFTVTWTAQRKKWKLPLKNFACAEEGPIGDPTCEDGRDNDCDGYTDGADVDCQ